MYATGDQLWTRRAITTLRTPTRHSAHSALLDVNPRNERRKREGSSVVRPARGTAAADRRGRSAASRRGSAARTHRHTCRVLATPLTSSPAAHMTDDDGVDRARARSGVTAARERRTAGSWCGVQHRQDGTCSDTTTRQMADAATPCSPRDIVRSVPYRANDARAHRDTEGESTRQEHTTRVWYRLYRSSRSQVVRKLRLDPFRSSPQGSALAELGSACTTLHGVW
jgi:hypothetical protein